MNDYGHKLWFVSSVWLYKPLNLLGLGDVSKIIGIVPGVPPTEGLPAIDEVQYV